MEFCPVIKRGATVKTIDEELSRFGRLRGTPHAVLLHVGTNSLANYFYADGLMQPWDQILDHHVQLADRMREAYSNETLIVVSAVLPRTECVKRTAMKR